jgi:sulfur carrier protein
MKVILRNPKREVQVAGGRRVKDVLRELEIIPETVLVIRGDTLVTADQMVTDDDTIELRPVMSGGSASGRASRDASRGEASGEMRWPCAAAARRGRGER